MVFFCQAWLKSSSHHRQRSIPGVVFVDRRNAGPVLIQGDVFADASLAYRMSDLRFAQMTRCDGKNAQRMGMKMGQPIDALGDQAAPVAHGFRSRRINCVLIDCDGQRLLGGGLPRHSRR